MPDRLCVDLDTILEWFPGAIVILHIILVPVFIFGIGCTPREAHNRYLAYWGLYLLVCVPLVYALRKLTTRFCTSSREMRWRMIRQGVILVVLLVPLPLLLRFGNTLSFLAGLGYGAYVIVTQTRRHLVNEALAKAIKTKDHGDIEDLLLRGAEPDARVPEPDAICLGTDTLFLRAAGTGDLEIVRLLLEVGANPNVADRDGRSPLFYGAGASEELVRELLRHGANPDAVDERGDCVLHKLAEAGAAGALERLIKRGADPNLRNGSRRTALHVAANAGRAACVTTLLAHGADATLLDHLGRTPVAIALREGRRGTGEVLEALRSAGVEFNPKSKAFSGRLARAAGEDDRALVDTLLDMGVAPNASSAMVNALCSKRGAAIVPLLKAGAEVEEQPLLQFIRKRESLDLLCELLEGDFLSIEAVERSGLAPLHIAAQRNHLPLAKQLISKGANVNVEDDHKITPLAYASLFAHGEISLSSAGTDLPDARDVAEVLVRHGADVNGGEVPPICWAALHGAFNGVKFLISAGANVNIGDPERSSPAFLAASYGHTEIAEYLASHGGKYNREKAERWWRMLQEGLANVQARAEMEALRGELPESSLQSKRIPDDPLERERKRVVMLEVGDYFSRGWGALARGDNPWR